MKKLPIVLAFSAIISYGTAHSTIIVPFDSHIAIADLPATVKPFVEQKFPGYHIKTASPDPLCDGSPAIDVVIVKKGMPRFSLIFKPDGTFVQKEEDVPISSAPQAVLNAFKKNFTGYKAAKEIEKLTLADNTTQYLLDISKGKSTKEAIFSSDGTLLCNTK